MPESSSAWSTPRSQGVALAKATSRTVSDRQGSGPNRRDPSDAEQIQAAIQRFVRETLVNALVFGAEAGSAAVSAGSGTVQAAGQIGAGVGRMARVAADGAMAAFDRIRAAAGRPVDVAVPESGNQATPEPAGQGNGAARPTSARRKRPRGAALTRRGPRKRRGRRRT